tara:strand:+ start:705 stop:1319 length:615 start_codon:yes stop_codon:yes gene_type:complete
MSQIKLLHSGGNGVILSAPDSNPASDRTLKLPGDADGTIATTATAGKVLQVVQQIRTDTVSESSLGNGATGSTDVLTKAITPSSSSSKVLVIMNATIAMSNGSERVGLLLHVGGSVIDAARADAASNRGRMSAGSYLATTDHFINLSQTFLHSPNTTSATTYSYRFISGSGATTTMYLNRTHADSDATWASRTTSNITLMEIAA